MKLPSLTLPHLPKPGLPHGAFAWRSLLTGIALFFVAFLLGFLLGFPTAAAKQKIISVFREGQATAELQTLHLSPLLALKGENLSIRMDNAGLPPLMVDRFSVRPLWGTLLSAEPGVKVDADLLQGGLQAEVQKGGRTQVRASGLKFTLPVENGTATISGTLSAGQMQMTASGGKTGESILSLTFAELLAQSPLLASTASRPLALGQFVVEAQGRGQAYTITRLESNGGDVAVSGTGSLLRGRTLASSRLNLNLVLRPTPSLPGEYRTLLALLGPVGGDGSYPLNLAGTLASPRLQGAGSTPPGGSAPAQPAREAAAPEATPRTDDEE